MYSHFFKRFFDVVISLSALIILSPLLLFVTVWLHFANKGAGAFFFQERPGKDGKIFKIIKFKTMTDERDAEGNLLPDADRLTKVGKFVRSTYLDYFSGVGRKTKEPLRITNSTTIEKVLEQCVHYTPIDYDSSPLIQSCPFEITYPFS